MIKLFEQYKEYDQVRVWLDENRVHNYTINDDLTVDVKGSVNIYNNRLSNIPVKFNKVMGDFMCYKNRLTSLEGCPKYINGWFDCSNNRLTSLEYCPEYIGGQFNCTYNELTTLKGSPSIKPNSGFIYTSNPLPKEILNFHQIEMLSKYQYEYGIWNSDGSFNKGRWEIFIKEFEDGLLE